MSMTNKAESLLSANGFWQSQPGVWTRAFGNPPMVVDFMRDGLRPGWISVAIPSDGLTLVVHAEQQQADAAALRQNLQGILNRFEREDTGKGFPERGGQIAWAMASDARGVLASIAAGQALLDRLRALEEALKPFLAHAHPHTGWSDESPIGIPNITVGHVRRATALLEQKGSAT